LPYGKFLSLGPSLALGYAGDPSVLYEVKNKLSELVNDETYESLEAYALVEMIKQAYASVRKSHVEDTILRPLGMDWDTFFNLGLAAFGSDKFHLICQQVEDYCVDLSLLLGGYCVKSENWILFRFDNPGVARNCIMQGFDAIGSGAGLRPGAWCMNCDPGEVAIS
jgi:hypothetical protein